LSSLGVKCQGVDTLALTIDLNLPAPRVIRTLERIAAWRGYPDRLRLDNGPELVSVALAEWAESHGVELDFIEPGKPTQNSFIERFNRTYFYFVRLSPCMHDAMRVSLSCCFKRSIHDGLVKIPQPCLARPFRSSHSACAAIFSPFRHFSPLAPATSPAPLRVTFAGCSSLPGAPSCA